MRILFMLVVGYTVTTAAIEIKSRTWWGALTPKSTLYQIIPVEYVIIHHTAAPAGNDDLENSEIILNTQAYHVDTLGYDDIGYNFMISPDGDVYEGVGWHQVGAHTYGYNSKSIGIALMGNYNKEQPSEKMLNATIDLLSLGVELGELDTQYKLLGARQVSATQSPGLLLYRKIVEFPHWTAVP